MRAMLLLLLSASASGCGAKTGLVVPPPPPCEVELDVPGAPPCARIVLGPPVALTSEPTEDVFRGVDQLDVAPIVDGVRVVMQETEWPRDEAGRSEMRSLALDVRGASRGPSETLLSFPLLAAGSLTEPTAMGWGCGDAVLADLVSTSGAGEERYHGCALRIRERGIARQIAIDADPCADLSWDGGTFSLLTVDRTGFSMMRVSTEVPGAEVVERVALDLPGPMRRVDLSWRRIPDGAEAWLWPMARSEGGADLLPLDASGNFGEPIPFSSEIVRDVSWAIDGEARRWMVWSEPDTVRLARLDEEGRIEAPVSVAVPEGTSIALTRARPAWFADRLLLPVHDLGTDEASILVVTPTGTVSDQLVLGPGPTLDVVAIPGGALVLHAEARTIERAGRTVSLGEVLVSRTLACE